MQEGKTSQEVVDVLNAQQPDSKAFKSKFSILNSEVTHENRIEVELTPSKVDELCIRNHFANISDNQVLKVTEIRLEDRVIRIIDTFTSINHRSICPQDFMTAQIPQTTKQGIAHKNLLEKRGKMISKDHEEMIGKIRDTKNVVKNIFRLFMNWVDQKSPSQYQNKLKLALQSLLETNGKYNNNLIISLSSHPELRDTFLAFSDDQGEQFIGRSKINDKQSHLQALKRYRKICYDEKMVQESVKNGKRKNSRQPNESLQSYGAQKQSQQNSLSTESPVQMNEQAS